MNFGNHPATAEAESGRPPGSFHLARQGSIYSLTFDELQNSMGSIGKDFGSMNMDELLKSIWNAEDIQTTDNNGVQDGVVDGGSSIQRQGSLTLPRTISQKTVDEVWKDISKELSSGFGQPKLPQRQQTLGEMTLEEFLVKAGVVREESQLTDEPNDEGIEYQQIGNRNVMETPENNRNQITFQSGNLPMNVNGVRSTATQQPQLFPKKTKLSYEAPVVIGNGVMGLPDPGHLVSSGMQQGGLGGMVGLGSPANGIRKFNGDSLSPAPYDFSGVVRGRKGGMVEKGVERRQKRMIKNRESAARSRARKQAYTTELEAEVAKLKEQNQELKRKAEMMEMQQNQQVLERMCTQPGAERRYLRRTQSGSW